MRPLRLELEGFSAYRDETVVDFEGVDLFALSGATGAGKSAILDAIAFALYGVVHRLGNKGTVEPVISQGLMEARVRLDFAVGDECWTAARVVRRRKARGASTAEARLEGPGPTVAGNAEEVTAAVTELLGLGYEHFSRCVVLPQGEFARFLHDKAADRQELLISLLELDLYGRVAALAGRRASEEKVAAARLEGRLAELAGATPDAVAAAGDRVQALTALVADLDDELPAIAALADEEAAARAMATARAEESGRLAAVAVPPDVAGLAEADRVARQALVDAEAACERADAEAEAAEARQQRLPAVADLEAVLAAFDRLDAAAGRRATGEAVVAERRAGVEEAEKAVRAADDELDAARREAERIQAAHRAHAVRADLVAGEPCPVCTQVVAVLPKGKAPAGLAAAAKAVQVAEAARRAAEAHRAAAVAELGKAETLLEQVLVDVESATAVVAGQARPDVEAELRTVREAATAAAAAAGAAKAARTAERAARAVASEAATALAGARDRFDAARDAVADLGAPARLGGGDLAAEWAALAAWAAAEAPGRRAAAEDAERQADERAKRRTEALRALAERCAAAGVDVGGRKAPRDAAGAALATATAAAELLARQVADAEQLHTELVEVRGRGGVARSLATHLDARHFEQWVLDEAVRALAEGATELLHGLSGGHYSLAVDGKGSFVVVDHHNADESRSARTLSGGETFLASLALALALADRIATLAPGGAERLDALFLDEGFGSLDPDTLDVVVTAIEELGAGGRMVGVVSHVAELAERVPVRYEVARSGNASTITRIDS